MLCLIEIRFIRGKKKIFPLSLRSKKSHVTPENWFNMSEKLVVTKKGFRIKPKSNAFVR